MAESILVNDLSNVKDTDNLISTFLEELEKASPGKSIMMGNTVEEAKPYPILFTADEEGVYLVKDPEDDEIGLIVTGEYLEGEGAVEYIQDPHEIMLHLLMMLEHVAKHDDFDRMGRFNIALFVLRQYTRHRLLTEDDLDHDEYGDEEDDSNVDIVFDPYDEDEEDIDWDNLPEIEEEVYIDEEDGTEYRINEYDISYQTGIIEFIDPDTGEKKKTVFGGSMNRDRIKGLSDNPTKEEVIGLLKPIVNSMMEARFGKIVKKPEVTSTVVMQEKDDIN